MKVNVKKIIKYLIILAVLGGAGFLVFYIFFPTPKPTEAYDSIVSISSNEAFSDLKEANEQIETMLKSYPENSQEDLQLKSQYYRINDIYEGMDNFNAYLCQNLAYAENNSVYNKEARQIKKDLREFNKLMEEVKSYLDTYYTPFFNQTETKTYTSVLSYANSVSEFNNNILESYTNILTLGANILPSLKETYLNNTFTQAKTKVMLAWFNVYSANFKTTVLNIVNVEAFVAFSSKYTVDKANYYYNNMENVQQYIDAVNACPLNDYLKVAFITGEYENYLNSLTEEKKTQVQDTNIFVLVY